jgi:hypothetical protein
MSYEFGLPIRLEENVTGHQKPTVPDGSARWPAG